MKRALKKLQLEGAPPLLIGYSAVLAVIALAVAGALTFEHSKVGSPWGVLCLAGVAAFAERGSVRLTKTTEASISLLPTLFAAVLFGPLASMIVGAASMALDIREGRPWPLLKWLTYTSSRAITAAAVGFAALAGQQVVSGHLGGVALATTFGAITAESLDITFAALTRRVRGNGSALEFIRTLGPLVMASSPLYAPIVVLLVVTYQEVSPWTLPLFMAPALAAQRLYALYQEQRVLAGDLISVNRRLERANLSFATALVATLDARDQYTAGHSAAVAIYARDIAARMGLSDEQQRLAHLCGLVHDIGKIGLPAGLLEKPGALTLEERRLMEQHAAIGERILAKVEDYSEIAGVVRHHHERVDGMGYPDELRADEIPLLSRIIAAADAYNAMTSDRPYRDAMPSRVARLRLAQAVESQFDTGVVAAFEAILAGASDAYRSGSRSDFSLEAQDEVANQEPSLELARAVSL